MSELVVVGTSFALTVKWLMHQYSQTLLYASKSCIE